MDGPIVSHVAIVCFINDPFDEPGGARFGGGHVVLQQLGQFLVAEGYDVSYVTRLNSPSKETRVELGPRCRIFRIPCGPKSELRPSDVGLLLDELTESMVALVNEELSTASVLHSQYWIAGEVCRRINATKTFRHVHYMLSFGRQKKHQGEQVGPSDSLRDCCEVAVFNSVDALIAQCPSEARDLLSYYPEVTHGRIVIIPHGVDTSVFRPSL